MRFFYLLLITLLANGITSTQAFSGNPKDDQVTAVDFAVTASVRVLNFRQGDLASLMDTKKDDFTSKGWGEAMKGWGGGLDDKGVAIFSSSFTPSGNALDIHRKGGILHLTIPGVLKQSQNRHGAVSTTDWRVEIEIQLAENLLKIDSIKLTTCGGAVTRLTCR